MDEGESSRSRGETLIIPGYRNWSRSWMLGSVGANGSSSILGLAIASSAWRSIISTATLTFRTAYI